MLNRRDFAVLTTVAGVAPLVGCSGGDMSEYEKAAAALRAPLPANPDLKDLVRFATLAANGHNTQPWHFSIGETGIAILPDLDRRTPVVDPDDHHLYVSLGCAAENILLAGRARGRPGAMVFENGAEGRIDVDLARAAPHGDELFEAIPERQSTRSEYDGRDIPADDLKRLGVASAVDGVSVMLITNEDRRNTVRDYLIEGNSAQVGDPAFVEELKDSIRFNSSEALRAGDGLFTGSSGNPSLPGWFGRLMFGLFFTREAENEKYARQMKTTAGVAVFVADREDRDHWVRVGRSFQRFALQATALGIRHAHINQPVEVPAVRSEFARWLGIGDARPDLVIRFGYAPPMPMSLRRPVEQVILPTV